MATIAWGPSVSVALCTHNGAAYIGQQLESILTQSLPPAEVIVSDDASTDGTLDYVRETWARAAPPGVVLRVIHNTVALGVVRNFEQAARAATSEIVALCDQDDVWLTRRLEIITERFAADPSLELLFSDATLIDGAGDPIGSLFGSLEIAREDLESVRAGRAFAVLLRRNLVTGATTVFRRGLLDRAAPFASSWVHDEWLAIIAAATTRIDWLPERLVRYRQHATNQIGVAAPTLRYKVGKVFEPRADRYTRLVSMSEELLVRLREVSAATEVIALAEGKLNHDRFRAGLPVNRLARILPVLRSASTGAYDQFCSRKRLDILRDLLQPR